MSKESSSRSGGVGFLGLLTLLFIALKLTGYITWSWFWVLSPLLFGVGLTLFLIVVFIIIGLVALKIGSSNPRLYARRR